MFGVLAYLLFVPKLHIAAVHVHHPRDREVTIDLKRGTHSCERGNLRTPFCGLCFCALHLCQGRHHAKSNTFKEFGQVSMHCQ